MCGLYARSRLKEGTNDEGKQRHHCSFVYLPGLTACFTRMYCICSYEFREQNGRKTIHGAVRSCTVESRMFLEVYTHTHNVFPCTYVRCGCHVVYCICERTCVLKKIDRCDFKWKWNMRKNMKKSICVCVLTTISIIFNICVLCWLVKL